MKPTQDQFNKLIKDSTNDLVKYVAEDIRDQAESYPEYGIEGYLKDLARSGCASGMVSELIYYKDTNAFFDRFYPEIMELVDEMEENLGEPLNRKGQDLKNFYAWFGYEEIARKIAEQLDIEL